MKYDLVVNSILLYANVKIQACESIIAKERVLNGLNDVLTEIENCRKKNKSMSYKFEEEISCEVFEEAKRKLMKA